MLSSSSSQLRAVAKSDSLFKSLRSEISVEMIGEFASCRSLLIEQQLKDGAVEKSENHGRMSHT